ncbi:hypothetical protein HPB50_014467 [Hyalomma asiaticum]|uniref:Uncharacterized protein n=1 Tax=Hyalomma asiaticum TaxID=266040 RepID=A0ACB7T2J7_HYAAI|nr:hypothetical protein HPB50_014467 [Hyalomma asiaticum]
MSSYELPANANEEVLRLGVKEMEGNLHSLNISNCIVAHPTSLLCILSSLKNLRTLSCIACPLKPSLLLDQLLTSLENLTRLEFSLVEAGDDATMEAIKVWDFRRVHLGKKTSLREIYVEVMSDDNMKLLLAFVEYSPLLKDIHIYFTNYIRSNYEVISCLRIVESLEELATFTISCEAPCTTQSVPLTQPLDLQNCMHIHGTLVFRKSPKALSYALLRDLATSPESTLPPKHAVLVALKSSNLKKEMRDAGHRHDWSELQTLCLLMFFRELHATMYPAVGAEHTMVLREFFARLSNLVELNVSSFHFHDDVDFTELMPTAALQRLRALSLPPCGLRHRGAVRRLAVGLGEMEELDIRINVDGRHNTCFFCNDQLVIEHADISALRIGSGRLTLSNVPRLASLNFLERLKVPHVRFIARYDIEDTHIDYRAFCNALRGNDTVRSIVLKLPDIKLEEESFETLLCPAKALERLCILTTAKLKASKAEMIAASMARRLPSIFYLHIHYVDVVMGTKTNVTWIRASEGDVAEEWSQPGKVMRGKPCIMCSTQTFVALPKPRCRELQ